MHTCPGATATATKERLRDSYSKHPPSTDTKTRDMIEKFMLTRGMLRVSLTRF